MLGLGTKAFGVNAVSVRPLYRSVEAGEFANVDLPGEPRPLRGLLLRNGLCDEFKGEAKPRSRLIWLLLLGVRRNDDATRGGRAGFLCELP